MKCLLCDLNLEGLKITMSAKSKPCAVTTVVNVKERSLFIAIARSLDIPYSALIRRLIRYFLEGKISWVDLFRQHGELPMADELDNDSKRVMRILLDSEQYSAFTQITEEWGSTTAIVIRRLMLLYITGKIERGDIWY
jgi:hypothetical protein